MPQEKRRGRPKKDLSNTVLQHTPSDDTSLDSGFSFPHTPMHAYIDDDEEANKGHTDPPTNLGMFASLGADKSSVALLTFLYVLQGIPLGLAGSIPYLLQSRRVSYKEQAIFSFVYWPFSLKLLWAPIVDATYFAAFGRRKSWLVPVQYLIGIFMFVLSYKVSDLLGEGDGPESAGPVSVTVLTAVFFMLNFLAATQDIVVDGWALTMLSRRNVAWASTCNTVGQTTGYFLGNILFLALESPAFCNSFLRSASEAKPYGVIDLAGFMYFWGAVFLVSTTLVMFIKREAAESNTEADTGIVDTYSLLWRIVKLPAVMSLISILLTTKMGFAAADAATGLKLIEEGVPKDKLAMIGVPMVPIQILLPIILSKYTTGPNPMNIYVKAIPFRLLMGLVFAGIVWWAPTTKSGDGEYPMYFYAVVVAAYALHQIALYCMYVTMMALYAKVADPAIGGSYMTLLNTISNFGGNWPATVALWMMDSLTWKQCAGGDGDCSSPQLEKDCADGGGNCATSVDGFFIESFVCFFIGIIWMLMMSKRVMSLQRLPASKWTCS